MSAAYEQAYYVAYPAIVGIVAKACYDDPSARALADKEDIPEFDDADEASVQAFWRHIAVAALNASAHYELVDALEIARGEISKVHQLRSALPQIDAALAKARGEQ